MDKLIGSVNTHESKGTDEDGVAVEVAGRDQDITAMKGDKLTQIMGTFSDSQQLHDAANNSAGGSYSDMLSCAAMYPGHPNMASTPYSNHQAREDEWLV